jgi:hypothetical protein
MFYEFKLYFYILQVVLDMTKYYDEHTIYITCNKEYEVPELTREIDLTLKSFLEQCQNYGFNRSDFTTSFYIKTIKNCAYVYFSDKAFYYMSLGYNPDGTKISAKVDLYEEYDKLYSKVVDWVEIDNCWADLEQKYLINSYFSLLSDSIKSVSRAYYSEQYMEYNDNTNYKISLKSSNAPKWISKQIMQNYLKSVNCSAFIKSNNKTTKESGKETDNTNNSNTIYIYPNDNNIVIMFFLLKEILISHNNNSYLLRFNLNKVKTRANVGNLIEHF